MPAVEEILKVTNILGLDLPDLASKALNAAFSRRGDKTQRLEIIEATAALTIIRVNNTLQTIADKPPEIAAQLLQNELIYSAQVLGLILKRADLDGSSIEAS